MSKKFDDLIITLKLFGMLFAFNYLVSILIITRKFLVGYTWNRAIRCVFKNNAYIVLITFTDGHYQIEVNIDSSFKGDVK